MTDVTFTPNVTSVDASWLNPVNVLLNDVFDGAQTKNDAANAINAINGVVSSGVGTGIISKGLSGSDVDNRTLLQSGNITITTGTDEVTLDVDSVTSSSNTGIGIEIAKTRSVDDLPFKRLREGANINITDTGDDIIISNDNGIVGTNAVNINFDPTNVPYIDTNLQDLNESMSDDIQTSLADIQTIFDQSFESIVMRRITTTSTYTPDVRVKYVIIELVGGGGGGGASGTIANVGASGGGSGGYCRKAQRTAGWTTADIVIGTGGAGGTGTGGGSTGASTIMSGNAFFGTTLTGFGGLGGQNGAATSSTPGGKGGSAIGGTTNKLGGHGGNGFETLSRSGEGGSSVLGTGAQGTLFFGTGENADAGTGAGGSGACTGAGTTGFDGGNGAAGAVVITEFLIA